MKTYLHAIVLSLVLVGVWHLLDWKVTPVDGGLAFLACWLHMRVSKIEGRA